MSTAPGIWCYQLNYVIFWTSPASVPEQPSERTTTVSSNNACVYTPGPWTVDDGEITASGFVLGLVYGTDDYPCSEDETREECQANARLIATAPELLELCRQALECLDKEWPREADKTNCLRQQLYGVIAKATGGQP